MPALKQKLQLYFRKNNGVPEYTICQNRLQFLRFCAIIYVDGVNGAARTHKYNPRCLPARKRAGARTGGRRTKADKKREAEHEKLPSMRGADKRYGEILHEMRLQSRAV